jgi:hypothetical protein
MDSAERRVSKKDLEELADVSLTPVKNDKQGYPC